MRTNPFAVYYRAEDTIIGKYIRANCCDQFLHVQLPKNVAAEECKGNDRTILVY